jgi:hypothetical protein
MPGKHSIYSLKQLKIRLLLLLLLLPPPTAQRVLSGAAFEGTRPGSTFKG